MVTINPKLEALTKESAQVVSDAYLRGERDLEHVYGFRLKGLNNKLRKFGLPVVDANKSIDYRIFYVKLHYTQDDIEQQLMCYMSKYRMDKQRDIGIELFNCKFHGKDYVKCFAGIVGKTQFAELSEKARLLKINETDQKLYGGVGLAGAQTVANAKRTNISRYGGTNVMDGKMVRDVKLFLRGEYSRTLNFLKLSMYKYLLDQLTSSYADYCKTGLRDKWLRLQSKFELLAFDALVKKYGYNDIFVQYGFRPYDDRYPYNCDFYIKSSDLFIEMNMYYSHQDHWFDANNSDDVLFLDKQRSLHTQSGNTVVDTWSGTDVKKRQTAKDNAINYLVFWDKASESVSGYLVPQLSDFYCWLNSYNGSYFKFISAHPENTY